MAGIVLVLGMFGSIFVVSAYCIYKRSRGESVYTPLPKKKFTRSWGYVAEEHDS